jgi:hypothetical protein
MMRGTWGWEGEERGTLVRNLHLKEINGNQLSADPLFVSGRAEYSRSKFQTGGRGNAGSLLEMFGGAFPAQR